MELLVWFAFNISSKLPPDAYDKPRLGFLIPVGNADGGAEKLRDWDEDEDEADREEAEDGEEEEEAPFPLWWTCDVDDTDVVVDVALSVWDDTVTSRLESDIQIVAPSNMLVEREQRVWAQIAESLEG